MYMQGCDLALYQAQRVFNYILIEQFLNIIRMQYAMIFGALYKPDTFLNVFVEKKIK